MVEYSIRQPKTVQGEECGKRNSKVYAIKNKRAARIFEGHFTRQYYFGCESVYMQGLVEARDNRIEEKDCKLEKKTS